MANTGRQVVVKVPPRPRTGKFTKRDFKIDLKRNRVTCPAGKVCHDFSLISATSGLAGKKEKRKRFTCDAKSCSSCALRSQCVTGIAPRAITLHPQEHLLREAREFQRSAAFRKEYPLRMVVEHRIARLVQLGIRKSRYFGRRKTLFPLLMAAAVANLTLLASPTSPMATPASSFLVVTLSLALLFLLPERQNLEESRLAG